MQALSDRTASFTDSVIRLHFAKKDETLTDALNRLESLREKIPAKG